MRTTLAILGVLLSLASAGVSSQAYPSKPIRMVVPFSAGGPTDLMARLVGNKAGEFLGQPFILDFKPGANAILGTEAVARALPDGYTVLMTPLSAVAINPVTYKSLPYDVARDLAPVTEVVEYGLYLIAHAGFSANSMSELVAYARKNSGKVTYASTGEGSPAHFGGVMLEDMAGIKMVHVPYKGNAPATTDLVAGRVDFFITSLTAAPAFIKAGKLKMLAYSGEKRSPQYPDIPTIAQSGYPGYWTGAYYTIMTRAGTPAPVINRMVTEFNRSLQDSEVKKGLEAQDFQVLANGSPEIVAKRIAAETKRWARLATQANIRFD